MKRFALMFLIVAAAFAGELTGKWTGTFQDLSSGGGGGSEGAYMELKLSGQTVTGTAGPDATNQMEISNGKLDGKKLTFDVVQGPVTMKFDLVFDGDTIKGTATAQNGGQEMKAKLDLKRKE